MVSPCSLSNTVPFREEDLQLDLNSWLVPSCAYGELLEVRFQLQILTPMTPVPQAAWLLNGTVLEK